MDAETGRVISLGIVLFLPALAVIWKASDLRGDLDKKWSERVDLARAGLSERAVGLLRKLQTQTDEVLGDIDDFDPDLVKADPGPLAKIAGNIQRSIKVRDRLKRRLRSLLALAYAAPVLAIGYALGVASATAWYAKWLTYRWLPEAGYWLAGVAIVLGLALVLLKFYFEQRLITAERMSRPVDAGKRSAEGVDGGDDGTE